MAVRKPIASLPSTPALLPSSLPSLPSLFQVSPVFCLPSISLWLGGFLTRQQTGATKYLIWQSQVGASSITGAESASAEVAQHSFDVWPRGAVLPVALGESRQGRRRGEVMLPVVSVSAALPWQRSPGVSLWKSVPVLSSSASAKCFSEKVGYLWTPDLRPFH